MTDDLINFSFQCYLLTIDFFLFCVHWDVLCHKLPPLIFEVCFDVAEVECQVNAVEITEWNGLLLAVTFKVTP